jgi:hypothetical protein
MAKCKNPAAVALGRLGGRAAAGAGARVRFAKMTPEERRALARKAIKARWARATPAQRRKQGKVMARARYAKKQKGK